MNYASFWRQLINSFLPMNYCEYENVDKTDTTSFLRKFALIVYAVIAAGYLFSLLGGAADIQNGKIVSEEDGYYYRIENEVLKIDKPILIDDPNKGIYVNITDEVESFESEDWTAFYDKEYTDVLLISRTNRAKMTVNSEGQASWIINYFDNMEQTSEAGRNYVSPNINAPFIAVLLITGVVFYFLYPFAVRISALVLSIIAKFFCNLFRLDTDGEQLKIFCVYAFIPAQILTLIGYTAFTLIYGADFLESGNGGPVYFVIKTAAAVLPLVMALAAAFADKKRYGNY